MLYYITHEVAGEVYNPTETSWYKRDVHGIKIGRSDSCTVVSTKHGRLQSRIESDWEGVVSAAHCAIEQLNSENEPRRQTRTNQKD